MSVQFYRMSREDLIDVLGLPKSSTLRLCQLKLAQVEVETRNRVAEANKVKLLEENLKDETEKYLSVKQTVDKNIKERVPMKKTMLNQTREVEFYQDKVNRIDINKLDLLEKDAKLKSVEVSLKRDKLASLRASLKKFEGLEPTNEALKQKIDQLKESRLSLEMSFS